MASTASNWRAQTKAFGRILLFQGDITTIDATAIVNAANTTILGGGGVDGAIHAAGGPAIVEECRQIRARQYPEGLPTGEAVLTNAGRLPAAHVIHTVGPIWHGGQENEPQLLANCYRNSLRLAADQHLDSVAFSAISTGDYGYPKAEATAIAVREVRAFATGNEWPKTIVFVTFDEEATRLYEQELGN